MTGQTTRLLAAFLAAALTLLAPVTAHAQSLIYFVRHAERADGGAGAQANTMISTPADPSLSAAGEARASKLAAMLGDAGIKAIYVTEFKRTQETAKPLAAKLGLQVQVVASKDYASLVSKIRANHTRDTVLVIGHSNTLPEAIKAFGGPEVKIADDDYSALYILAPVSGALTLIRY